MCGFDRLTSTHDEVMKSARSPSAQSGELLGEQRNQFSQGCVSSVRCKPRPWQGRSRAARAAPSAVPGPGGLLASAAPAKHNTPRRGQAAGPGCLSEESDRTQTCLLFLGNSAANLTAKLRTSGGFKASRKASCESRHAAHPGQTLAMLPGSCHPNLASSEHSARVLRLEFKST